MAQKEGEPYWLIREPGKSAGFGTVGFNGDRNADRAVLRFMDEQEEAMRALLSTTEMEAVLVTISYKDGQPVVEPVLCQHGFSACPECFPGQFGS
jgi:hypothetical protein